MGTSVFLTSPAANPFNQALDTDDDVQFDALQFQSGVLDPIVLSGVEYNGTTALQIENPDNESIGIDLENETTVFSEYQIQIYNLDVTAGGHGGGLLITPPTLTASTDVRLYTNTSPNGTGDASIRLTAASDSTPSNVLIDTTGDVKINNASGFTGTVTTGSLVGKTITITKGIITGFA